MKIPKIGYGAGNYNWSDNDIDIIQMAINNGMTLIDTAEGYDNGNSEKIIGKAIKKEREKVLILTKFSPENSSYDQVVKACEGSLRRLKTDYIDLYQIHWPSATIPFEETIGAMEKLVQDGKIIHIGAGNILLYQLEQLYSICGDKLEFIQVEYNLFDRGVESDIMPYCQKNNIAIIAYSPLDRGRMANGEEAIGVLQRIAEKHNKDVSQLVLNWLVSTTSCSVIPKSSNREHLLSNSKSLSFKFSGQDLKDIGEACQTEVVYIEPSKIRVSLSGEDNRDTYQTVEDAMKNSLGYCPSPNDLSKVIKVVESIKPVRVVKDEDRYSLVEGRIRYWAWVIAKDNKPIPSIIRKEWSPYGKTK